MVLSNEIASCSLELINDDLDNEIFRYFIISDPDFLLEHTNEVVFHDEELDLYIWAIDHFATA
jgi:hypothetical protein ELI_2919